MSDLGRSLSIFTQCMNSLHNKLSSSLHSVASVAKVKRNKVIPLSVRIDHGILDTVNEIFKKIVLTGCLPLVWPSKHAEVQTT